MKQSYPSYRQHGDIDCFHCGDVINSKYENTEYPDGKYRVFCGDCKHFTFYDIVSCECGCDVPYNEWEGDYPGAYPRCPKCQYV